MPIYRKTGPPGLLAKFFINLHLAGSIYRRGLKIFLEVFALAPFPLPSFLHVKIKRAHALPADFSEVPFETYIIVDNLYQGYLQTQSDDLLDELANVLYGKPIKLKPYERINIFYWVASLKDFFARRYPDFLQPVSAATGGNLLGLLFLNLVFDIIHHVVEVESFFCVYVYLAFSDCHISLIYR